MKKRVICLFMCVVILCASCFIFPETSLASNGNRVNMELTIDGKQTIPIKGYYVFYTYNTYISLEDLAWALKGTNKAFDIKKDSDEWSIKTGTDYTGEKPSIFTNETSTNPSVSDDISCEVCSVKIDNYTYQLRLYDTYEYSEFDGDVCGVYMRAIDLGLFMNIELRQKGYGELAIDTSKDFNLSMEELEKEQYWHDMNGIYLGNINTGEVLATWNENEAVAIASTSKLMTATLVLDAIKAGKISMDTVYTVSPLACYQALSGEDGLFTKDDGIRVKMKVGQTWDSSRLVSCLVITFS